MIGSLQRPEKVRDDGEHAPVVGRVSVPAVVVTPGSRPTFSFAVEQPRSPGRVVVGVTEGSVVHRRAGPGPTD
jgi:hypothetical protein